jgi:aminoglycoside phosphotransferase (APT) family kinase protein
VLLVCSHRLWPRRLSAWREYGRQTAGSWRRAAAALGLEAATAAGVQFDGARVTGLVVGAESAGDARAASRPEEADRLAVRVAGPGTQPRAALAAIVDDASRRCGVAFAIERVGVRKIGKTAVFLAAADGHRFVLRVPRSAIARARAARNYATLESLHASALPPAMKALVPVPLARAEHAGYAYFVESCLPGRSGPSPAASPRHGGWDAAAVDFVTALHQATRQTVEMDDAHLERLVREPFARLAAACDPAAAAATRLAADCERALAGAMLPLVQVHGDCSSTNCLFDAAGRLTGVIDWEVAIPLGLPLLDLLQLMPVPGETSAHPRWQRFDAWLELLAQPARVVDDPVLGGYLRALSVPPAVLPALVVMQWATHVAERAEARADDERWMRQRVWQPLEALRRPRD